MLFTRRQSLSPSHTDEKGFKPYLSKGRRPKDHEHTGKPPKDLSNFI